MNCDDIRIMISDYIDYELPKEEEGFLFTHLAACSECCEEFKRQNQIQHEVKIHQKDVSEKFEKRIFSSIQGKNKSFTQKWITKPTPAYINYILGIVILVITVFSFIQVSALRYDLHSFQDKYANSVKQIQSKTEQIYFLMNGLPSANVIGEIKNLIVVKAKI